MTDLRLVVFDVDGTLVDSQAHILSAMAQAFAAVGRPAPSRAATLGIVGLSLPVAMARLVPGAPEAIAPLVAAYREAFASLRAQGDPAAASPLFPGARACIEALFAQPATILGVATGKSRRGLDHLFELHDIARYFDTVQVADHHPSKPHPAMLEACLADTGVPGDAAVMVGDTTYDIEMGRSAGFRTVGVSWGYHPAQDLQSVGADLIVDDFATLPRALDRVLPAS